jgi:polysaccharide biosynthesis/export protein
MEGSRPRRRDLARRWPAALALPILAACWGCGSTTSSTTAKPPSPPEKPVELTTFSFDQGQAPYDVFSEYRIVPGDLLDVLFQVRTWTKRESFTIAMDHTVTVKFVYAPELNTTQQVRPDGTITLPYLGSLQVVEKRVDELAAELREKYKPILNIPEISVEVPEFLSGIKELKADLHTTSRGLSRLVTVRPDGYVTFPMVGDVMAAGRTVPEVSTELNAAYARYLPGLNCDLFLEKPAGQVLYVVGQVARPGGFELKRPITLLEAVSLAGGHLPGAQLSSVLVLRRHEGRMAAARVNLKHVLSSGEGQMFVLRPDDIVYVPKTWLRSAAEVAKDLADMIFFRGWSLYGSVYFDNGLHVFGNQK